MLHPNTAGRRAAGADYLCAPRSRTARYRPRDMDDDLELWTREDMRLLEWQFLQRIPNVTRVTLNPDHLREKVEDLPLGVLWIVQGRVAYGVPVFYN